MQYLQGQLSLSSLHRAADSVWVQWLSLLAERRMEIQRSSVLCARYRQSSEAEIQRINLPVLFETGYV